jgi:dTDP-4-dehydrorhamnose reductase
MGATRVSVLITGCQGQLGRELQRAFRASAEGEGRASPPKAAGRPPVRADAPLAQARHRRLASLKAGLLATKGAEVLALDLPELDVTDAEAVERALRQAKPDLVIHAAALTDTSLCEEDPALAMRVNAQGSLHVAEACRRAGAALVYVSTNEVFDGARGEPYGESDEPSPINAYGRSKLEGERFVQQTLPRHYVVRTAWLYAEGGDNFPAKILRAAEGRRELSVVTDEVATPTWARDLAPAIIRLAALRASAHPAYGIYHLTNDGYCSRFQWAAEVLRLAGPPWADVTLRPITSAEYTGGPPKPPFSALRNEAAARLGITLRPWQEALEDFFRRGG